MGGFEWMVFDRKTKRYKKLRERGRGYIKAALSPEKQQKADVGIAADAH